MNDAIEKLRKLSPEKRALLEKMIREKQKNTSSPAMKAIPTVGRDSDYYAVSSAQQRLWFMEQITDSQGAFNLHAALRFSRPLSVDLLEKSFYELLRRHEILRTRFKKIDSQIFQCIDLHISFSVKNIELGDLTRDGQVSDSVQNSNQLEQLIRQHSRQHFSLETGPLLAATLVDESESSQVLLLAMHHILSDAWSMTILLKELMIIYDALQKNNPPQLNTLEIQYLDYAVWQRHQLVSEENQRQLDYWKTKLKGAPQALDLPIDYPRPEIQSYKGDEIQFRIARETQNTLRNFVNSEGITLFMLGLAAYGILLGRLSKQGDILIGTDIANREAVQTEPLIGFFVNQLVLRCQFSPEQTVRSFLQNVKKTCLEAYANQNVQFNQLVEVLDVSRDTSRTPLYQAKFMLQNTQDVDANLLGFEPVILAEETSQFDLLLALKETPTGILGSLRYATALFTRCTGDRLSKKFIAVLEQIPLLVDKPISALNLLTREERDWLSDNNNTSHTTIDDDLFNALEKFSENQPAAIAVSQGNRQLSYKVLLQKVDRLASYYYACGLNAGMQVAICMSRNIDMHIAILAAMRAGICYIPLDPDYGPERLKYIVEDAKADVVLVSEDQHWLIGTAVRIQKIDADLIDSLTDTNVSNWPCRHTQQRAYTIYTSGSTGNPKGVSVPWGAFNNFLQDMKDRLGINSDCRFAAVTTIAFDIAALELFLPLFCGAEVVLSTRQQARDSRELLALLNENKISHLQATPATWRGLNAVYEEASAIKKLVGIVGGEALRPLVAEQMLQICEKVINVYGPTETTIWSTSCEITREHLKSAISIGDPISNTQVYVLDNDGQLQGFSCSGELYIGGAGVAHGYWNKPALTAQAFLPDPFGTIPGSRIYRTGDLVRRTDVGQLIYQGRNDSQVKIRGFRIELGEIEAVLQKFDPQVNIAVGTRSGADQDLALVTFLGDSDVLESNRFQYQQALTEYAELHLPEYMLPRIFIWLDAMPLTANGKLDRKALHKIAVDHSLTAETRSGTLANTAREKCIADIWVTVLDVTHAYLEDNFFTLGGHSLLAIRLLDEVEKTTGQMVALQQFFKNPTLGGLIDVAYKSRKSAREFVELIPDPENASQPFPLTDIQQAYLVGRNDGVELGGIATQNYVEINVRDLDVNRFIRAWNQLLKRHGMLRAVFDAQGSQRIPAENTFYTPIYKDLTLSSGVNEYLEHIRLEMQTRVLSTDTGPLFDLRITRTSDKLYRIHLVLDMLIVDVSSTYILFTELGHYYNDPETVLPGLDITFRDYILAERKLKESSYYLDAKNYWLSRVDHFPSAPELPVEHDIPFENDRQSHFVRRQYHIEQQIWQAIVNNAKSHQISPTVILLTAFGETLSRWSKSPHFAINLTLFNRLPLHDHVDSIIGDFTSSLLLEQDHREVSSFDDSARRIQNQLWRDLDNKVFNGVEFIRELTRREGRVNRAVMPVVFTSILGLDKDAGVSEANVNNNSISDIFDVVDEDGYSVSQTSQVWLDHQVAEENGGITLVWDAMESIFPTGVLDDMFSVYISRIKSLVIAENWALPIVAIPPHQAEQRALVNNTARNLTAPMKHAATELLHSGFERQVKVAPDQVAIITDQCSFTYHQLDHMSSVLALKLSQLSVRPNTLVSVCMRKGFEQIVAVLAILKAGAAYLPVDANLPPARQEQLLVEGQCQIALTQRDTAEVCLARGLAVLVVSTDLLAEPAKSYEPVVNNEHDIAYVIFTSGSTGKPKGVVIAHHAALNTIRDINARFNVNEFDRVLALSSLSFDLSVFDIFGVLSVGGALVIPALENLLEPSQWWGYVERCGVTIWNTVPALMQLLVNHCEQNCPAHLANIRLVMMSGDWIPVSLPDQIKMLSGCQVVSLGGATEVSIWSIYYPIVESTRGLRSIPYGKPLDNQSFYVLDKSLRECPDWVEGDLYIGGLGLAKGYWQDPQRTGQSFIDTVKYGRIYRTGDLGRYIENGEIEFLGRNDGQVKIQGFRVELGEIENHLRTHPVVADAVVNAIGEAQGSKTLVAYLLLKNKLALTQHSQQISTDIAVANAPGVTGVLLSPIERSLFKLQQKSVRVLSDSLTRMELAKPEKARIGLPDTIPQHPMGCYQALINLLGFLRQESLNGHPLGKYFYPSASSLYPVQIYSYLNEDDGQGQSGFYYYSSRENSLVKLAQENLIEPSVECKTPTVYLLIDWDAILPMYIPALAKVLAKLEAGYLFEFIRQQALHLGVSLSSDWCEDLPACVNAHLPGNNALVGKISLENITDWQREPSLKRNGDNRVDQGNSNSNVILPTPQSLPRGDMDIIQRQSYREFLDRSLSHDEISAIVSFIGNFNLRTIIYLKGMQSIEGNGWYEYDPASHVLRRLTTDLNQMDVADIYLQGGNEGIFHKAVIGLYFIDESGSSSLASYIEAGRAGQRVVSSCWSSGIGFCPIGTVNNAAFNKILGLPDQAQVVHSLLGGAINFSQTQQWNPTDSKPELPTENDFIEYLGSLLPQYMIPRVYIPIEAIPLSSNGKVNRGALPVPDFTDVYDNVSDDHNSASTPLERSLVKIWSHHLKLTAISLRDNFFTLGGNSLMAMQVVADLRSTLGIEISLRSLFENPTIAQLSKVINKGAVEGPEYARIYSLEGVRQSVSNVYPALDYSYQMSLAQEYLYSVAELQNDKSAYNIPAALNIQGVVHTECLKSALEIILQRHEALRSVFRYINGELCQCTIKDMALTFNEIDIRHVDDPDARERYINDLLESDALMAFDLANGPLIRTKLIRSDEKNYVLMLNVHHIISDFLSMDILVQELGLLYENLSTGKTPLLPELPLQFAEFTAWQQSFLKSENASAQLDYWCRHLDQVPKLIFPDETAGANQTEAGGWHTLELSPSLLEQLRVSCRAHDITFFMLGLASIHQLVEFMTGTADIVVGTPFSTRFNADLEKVMGLMLNTLAIRINTENAATVDDLMQQVKSNCLAAFEQKDIPFEAVQNTLRKKGQYLDFPVYRVRYVYRKITETAIDNRETYIADRSINRTSAKFDLLISLNESENRLFGEIEYRTDVWNKQTIIAMGDYFEHILKWFSNSENQLLGNLKADLTRQQQHRIEQKRASIKNDRGLSLASLIKQKNKS